VFNLLEKLVGFFDRRFVLAYWAPVVIGISGLAMVVVLDLGLRRILKGVEELSTTGKIGLATSVVVTTAVLAYALQALTGPMVRLYEGYSLPRFLARQLRRSEEQELDRRLAEEAAEGGKKSQDRYLYFPEKRALVRPTRLGNTLTAAEEYPGQVYGLNSVFWWPRLSPLLPESFQTQVEAALLPMVALLNLCSAFVTLAFGGAAYLYFADRRVWVFAVPLFGGVALARVCYRAAVSQAVSYGNVIRVAFDFYRHSMLGQMKLTVPDSLAREAVVWDVLQDWLYYYERPWNSSARQDDPFAQWPFRYAAPSEDAAPSAPKPGAGAGAGEAGRR
jgi:hypothetical protein